MKVRTIISLEREQLRALKATARSRNQSVAELVRGLVEDCLNSDPRQAPMPPSAFDRMIGVQSSGRDDIGDRHDAALGDALRRENDR